MEYCEPSFFPLYHTHGGWEVRRQTNTWDLEEHTYGCGVNPTDLRLELRHTNEENYVGVHLAALPSRCRVYGIRGVGDVGLDMAQRFELVCWL